MLTFKEIPINYKYTNNAEEAETWLRELPELIACDFETASRFKTTTKECLKLSVDRISDLKEKIKISQYIESTGLSHPSLSTVTHLSIAWSDRDAIVLVCDNDTIIKTMYNYLVTTDNKQLWHNGGNFDFKFIYHHTKKLPKNYIDTLLLAKTLINDANANEARVNLKDLMGWKYGRWAQVKEGLFTLENMYNETMIKYAATDACATYSLYQDIKNDIDAYNNGWNI